MPPWSEVLGNRSIRGEESLRVPCGLKSLHAPLPLARRLMGVLGAVIEVAVLAMFHPRQDLALRRAVAFQLIRDDDPGHADQTLEELAEKLLRRLLVPAALHENIQDVAVLIHRAPQIVTLLIDREEDLIQMPFVTRAWRRRRRVLA